MDLHDTISSTNRGNPYAVLMFSQCSRMCYFSGDLMDV